MEVNWGSKRGWLPGTFESYASSADPDETFKRVRVKMDNGFCCDGSGYHPDCVRPYCGCGHADARCCAQQSHIDYAPCVCKCHQTPLSRSEKQT